MNEIIERIGVNGLILISFSPLIGLLIGRLSKKISLRILVFASIFSVFILTGYSLLTDWLYVISFTLILSAMFAYLVSYTIPKIRAGILIPLWVLCLFSSIVVYLYSAFGGYETREYSCSKDNYKIECGLSQGFSGRGVTIYYLYYAPVWGMIYKNIETVRIDPYETQKECLLTFKDSHVVFDKCSQKIIKTP